MATSKATLSVKKTKISSWKSSTLKLEWPLGQTLALSILFFALFYILGEGIANTRAFQSFLIQQTWDIPHHPFERQLARLDRIYLQEGKVDCIFLGNSMVWRGFDPEAFLTGYREKTGENLRCFNFGVDGMPASNAGAVSKILVEDYHPKLLIYGTDARDYAVPANDKDALILAKTDWLKYRMGKFSLKGWFIEHSELYRYRITLQHLLRFDYQYTVRNDPYVIKSSLYGFDSDPKVGNITEPPQPGDPRGHIQYYYRLLSNYEMLPENLAGLTQVLAQEPNVGSVLVVEMPVPDTYMHFFGDKEDDYQRFINRMRILTQDANVSFWQTTNWDVIPEDGWVDYSHLNTKGAKIFSQVLGIQIGDAVLSGFLNVADN